MVIQRIIHTPLLSHRLASTALLALQVDTELSPLVRRRLTLVTPSEGSDMTAPVDDETNGVDDELTTILRTEYRATTNRMLRVAVNGFMESLGVVLHIMQELDVDVLEQRQA